MPEYDITNYPQEMTPFVNNATPGRPSTDILSDEHHGDIAAAWPASPVLPEQYHGAPPAREWETISNRVITAAHVPAVVAPTDPGPVLASIAPPPAPEVHH
jgi:hypothetical protein